VASQVPELRQRKIGITLVVGRLVIGGAGAGAGLISRCQADQRRRRVLACARVSGPITCLGPASMARAERFDAADPGAETNGTCPCASGLWCSRGWPPRAYVMPTHSRAGCRAREPHRRRRSARPRRCHPTSPWWTSTWAVRAASSCPATASAGRPGAWGDDPDLHLCPG
jgi:hypothetical protein